jgi:SAM-dependent methyltransferase
MKMLKSIAHRVGQLYIKRLCLSEYEHQIFDAQNERPIEYRFALQNLAECRPESILDVGSGTSAWPHLLRNCGFVVAAIDNIHDYWPRGMVNRHWTILDVDILNPDRVLLTKYEAITCISVLEHIEDHVRAVSNMVDLLKTNGHLIITTPYSHYNPHPNVYTRVDTLYGKDAPYICRSSSASELDKWLSFGLTLVDRELWRLFTGPVWASGQRCVCARAETEDLPHQLGCFFLRKR